MDESRRGQIAIMVVKSILREKGVQLTPNFRREIGNRAKEIGISTDELLEFVEPLVRELVDETFTKKGKDEIGSKKCWDEIDRKEKGRRS